MKLFIKQFSRTISLVLLMLALFGSLLLYSSFRMSLEEEVNHMSQEVGMFSYALISSLSGLPADYEAVDYAVAQIGSTMVRSAANSDEIIRIYNGNTNEIYVSSNDFELKVDKTHFEKNTARYEIVSLDGEKYLQTFSVVDSEKGKYYLEISRNISFIYENRSDLYRQYILALAVGIVLSALLSIFITIGFTRPLIALSRATRSFAEGDYERRIEVKGDDEISILMEDFNDMADKLEENMSQLEYQAKVQEEFTAAFAHELKTPLTSIVGYSDMLRSMDLDEEDVRTCANYIFKQGSRLEKLSYKLLELVGIDKDRIDFKRIKVKSVAAQSVKMLEKLMEKKQIDFEIFIEEGTIWGDEDLLISLISNLLDNSRKACGEEGGKIILEGSMKKDSYIVTVEDNGCGISDDDIDKVKEAFYMVDKSRARKEGGAGIGMSLCEKIVSLHNATWEIYSDVGIGTKVEICFPAAVEEDYDKK